MSLKLAKSQPKLLEAERPLRVCVVGSGTRFLSGISYYTNRLANALASSHQVSVILMRQLLPTRLYPGRQRVGANLTEVKYNQPIQVFDGVDWFWLPSLLQALTFVKREQPDVMVFQWWTGTVFHSYLILALAARLRGTQVVIEFHEVLDTGEARMWLARFYVGLVAPMLVRLANGFVIHSEFDRPHLEKRYKLGERPIALIPHGPYDHYSTKEKAEAPKTLVRTDSDCCNLLYFGVIRPYKGLEDLLRAFEAISEEEIGKYRLTIVGETWEGWTLPSELIEGSRYRERISFINRYVRDEEVAQFFAEADAVVLPYRRSSASGPLHIAMSQGLPLVVTHIGGLVEAVANYEGGVLVPPQNSAALKDALVKVAAMKGQRFADPHSWQNTVTRYKGLFATLKTRWHEIKEKIAA